MRASYQKTIQLRQECTTNAFVPERMHLRRWVQSAELVGITGLLTATPTRLVDEHCDV